MNGNKAIAVNSIVIFLRLCITSVVSIFASRIILDALGASDYGLYNVVGGIVALLNVINSSMISTTYRFIAYELGKSKDDSSGVNKIFNTSFVIHSAFALLIIILGLTVGLWYVHNILNVSPDKIDDACFVLTISVFTTAISTMMVPYQGLLVAYEKFTVNAVIDVIFSLLRISVLALFLYTDGNRLRLYSIIMLLYTFLSNTAYFSYCFKKFKDIVRFKFYKDKAKYVEMYKYAGWILFGATAYSCKSQGSNIIINFFFGTLVNAAYGVANQVEGFIMSFSRTLNSAAIPQITKNVGGGNVDRSVGIACYISKYTFILMSLVAFPVLVDMDFLLGLWLKEVPDGAATFCKLMVLGGVIDCLGEGISPLVNATGKVKDYVFVIHTAMLLGLPIAFVLYKIGLPPYTILIVFCGISFICAMLKIYMLRRLLKFDVMLFVKTSYVRIIMISIPLIIFYYFYNPADFTFWEHILGLIVAEVFLLGVICILGLDKKERNMVKTFIGGKFKRV